MAEVVVTNKLKKTKTSGITGFQVAGSTGFTPIGIRQLKLKGGR